MESTANQKHIRRQLLLALVVVNNILPNPLDYCALAHCAFHSRTHCNSHPKATLNWEGCCATSDRFKTPDLVPIEMTWKHSHVTFVLVDTVCINPMRSEESKSFSSSLTKTEGKVQSRRLTTSRIVQWLLIACAMAVCFGLLNIDTARLVHSMSSSPLQLMEARQHSVPKALPKESPTGTAEAKDETPTNAKNEAASAETPKIVPREYPEGAAVLMREQQAMRGDLHNSITCQSPRAGEYGNNTNASLSTTKPSVAFLFLSGDKKERNMFDDMWEAWFPPKEDERYTVWVHTKPKYGRAPLGPWLCPYAIPSVESQHWWLHFTMIQLLKVAYQHSTASHFIFISSTTVPLWPFEKVYNEITSHDQQSCFCLRTGVAPLEVWSYIGPLLGIEVEHRAKAEMWSYLSRKHVKLILQHEEEMKRWHNASVARFATHSFEGAPDEMFLPTLLTRHNLSHEFVETHGPVHTSEERNSTGCCTHYVGWDIIKVSHNPANHWLTRKCAMFLGEPPPHPCAYKNILMKGLMKLQPDYMFLRKVWHGATIELENGEPIKLMEGLKQLGVIPP